MIWSGEFEYKGKTRTFMQFSDAPNPHLTISSRACEKSPVEKFDLELVSYDAASQKALYRVLSVYVKPLPDK